MANDLLEIRNLHVTYKTDEYDVFALNGVELSVKRGETLGLVGETGAGKTTTALSIMRLLPDKVGVVTAGEILFEGRNLLEADEDEMRSLRGRDISMIFQDPMTSLNPVHTVGSQIAEVVEIHEPDLNADDVESKVDEMMRMVGIPVDRKNDFPHQFSGGMRQRIVIAMSLACAPKIILADEPTTALDVTIQAQILRLMGELKTRLSTSMILITHDLGVVAQICDSVAVMYAGEIVENGTAEDIFEGEAHHPYTIGLFGSIPDLTKKVDRLTPIEGLMPDPTKEIEGCKFSDRCPYVMDICWKSSPSMAAKGTHKIRCHLQEGVSSTHYTETSGG